MNITDIKKMVSTLVAGGGISIYCFSEGIESHLHIVSVGPNQYRTTDTTNLTTSPTEQYFTYDEMMKNLDTVKSKTLQSVVIFSPSGAVACSWWKEERE